MHLTELLDRVILEQTAAKRKPSAIVLGADIHYRLCCEVPNPQHESLPNSYRGLLVLEGMLGELRVLSAFRS